MTKSISNELKIFAKNLSILIVEDDKNLSEELSSFLELFFKKVYVAYDGEEGLKKYRKNRCDIVITDINMPKKNGIELAKQIRILDKTQVILVLSGYIDTFVIQLIDIGIQGLMIKPYDMDDFLQKLLVQCENIIFTKEFEKMKLNKALEKNSNKSIKDSKKENKNDFLEEISQEVVELNTTEESIDNYIKNFDVHEEVDDTMWRHISEDILDLNDVFEENINKLTLYGLNEDIKEELIKIFGKYYSSINFLPKMEKFAYIFQELSDILEEVDVDSLDKDTHSFDILEFIYEDLINFFNVVFVSKETKNLHYLTDSLQSSVEQLKINLGQKEELEEDELELF